MTDVQGEITESQLEARVYERKLLPELRAKYNEKDREEAAEKGEAMSGGSYPIKDEDDLKKAIKAVGRGNASHDSIRKHIIARAKALKLSSLIPDNWNADGSLKETNSVWATLEQRETYNDRRRAIEQVICDSLPKNDSDRIYYCYVSDMTDDWAVYEYEGDLFQVSYTEASDGSITLGATTKVRPVTTYVEAESQRAAIIPDPDAPTGECTICNGSGSINGAECTICGGSGKNPAEGARGADEQFEWRKAKAEAISAGRTPERRAFEAEKLEIREDKDGGWTLCGYASVTEAPYEVGFYTERIARGAFKRTLKDEPDVVLLLNHGDGGSGLPLARTKSGTLSLEEDRNGLYLEANLDPLDPDAQLLRRKMKRGDLDGQMSFAFQPIDQDWNDDFTERLLRSVNVNRGDVSIVTQGANPATSSTIRSFDGAITEYVAMEQRAGRVLSSQNVEALKEILSRVASADENLDEVQPMLAKLLGVANPDKPNEADKDANSDPDGSTAAPVVSVATDGRSALDGGVMPDFTVRARQKLQAMEMRQRGRKVA